MRRLIIVQPYVPRYRESFFGELIERLHQEGIDCKIAAPLVGDSAKARADSATGKWIVECDQHELRIGRRRLVLGGSASTWKQADGVILGSQGTSIDVYRAIARRSTGRRIKVGLWGHIKDYVNPSHPLDRALEKWQLKRADHVFAYTPGGADYARAIGVVPERISVVMNSTDTDALQGAIERLDSKAVSGFRSQHGLTTSKIFGYLGGLDRAKRIDFLVDFLDELWIIDREIKLLIGGRGEDEHLLDNAIARGQAISLGYADANIQAIMSDLVKAIVMPGRIGLIAVDALTMRVPIITTDWPFHAPEAEYLTEGSSRFNAPNDPHGFAAFVAEFAKRSDSRIPSFIPAEAPTLKRMVDNYASGVIEMFHAPQRQWSRSGSTA